MSQYWINSNPSGKSTIDQITANSGIVVVPDSSGNVNILGTGSITTVGTTNTETIQLTGLTNHNVLVGAGTATITNVPPSSTSGIPLVSNGSSSDPSFSTALVPGGGTGLTSATAYAVLCGGTTSTGAFQSIASVGTSGQVLTSNGAGVLPTFQAAAATGIATITGSSGGAESPDGSNNFNILGSGSITTVGSSNTETVQLTGLTNHAVLVGAGTSTITKLAVGTNGQVLIGSSAADPVFGTLTSSDGSVTFTTGAGTLSLQVTGGTSVLKTLTGTSGGALSPTSGNITFAAASTGLTLVGSGSTLTFGGTLSAANGGTGVANNSASTITISGNFGTTFTVSGTTSVTLPTSGTLTTLATVTSTANNFTAGQSFAFATLTDAATVAINLALANNFILTLGGNRTLGVPTNPVAGQSGVISVRQDITGSRTLAYSWPYQFVGGTAPTLSTGKLVFDQLMYMVNSYATSTVTITIATPAVVTWTGHGLVSGQRVQFATTGSLPTGLSTSTTYWITVIDANTFNVSTSLANAQAATFVATSGSQSGTQTATNFSITLTINPAIA